MWEILSAGLFLTILIIVFFPGKGLYVLHRKSLLDKERIQNEDALKKLYDHEYVGEPASLNSLAGALELPLDRTTAIIQKLSGHGLVAVDAKIASPGPEGKTPASESTDIKNTPLYYTLTDEGRRYALRIIRMHRLWERYFSDRTGIAREKWHREAEIREHYTSAKEAELLARSMGNPSYDPDGDPIPTASGEIPPLRGIPLSALETNEFARIKHIEDEPELLYQQLIAKGLYPGMGIEKVSTANNFVTLRIHGKTVKISRLAAGNITVVKDTNTLRIPQYFTTLADLPLGASAEVTAILPACQGTQRRRLLDLGILPGTRVVAELSSYSGNPTAYKVRGASIALRKDQANLIQIKKDDVVYEH